MPENKAETLTIKGRQVILPCSLRLSDGSTLLCSEQVRHLPGKRLVLKGRWHDQAVFAKLFIHPRRAAIHQKREWRGYQAFQHHHILTPSLLFSGRQQQHFVMLFQAIDGSRSAGELWDQLSSRTARAELLQRLVLAVAAHHHAGLWQQDLHPDNFLIQNDQLYSLDGADIQEVRGALRPAVAFRNLGLLFAQFPPEYETLVDSAYSLYAQARAWPVRAKDQQRLARAIRRQRAWRKALVLKKVYRDCTAVVCQQTLRHRKIYVRAYDTPAFRTFLDNIDSSLTSEQTKMLKKGNTATVWETQVAGQRLVVKRYNLKSAAHGWQRALRRTRASISWENAHRLLFYGIATPAPIALIEQRFGPVRKVSYFISEYCAATDSKDYFQEINHDPQEITTMVGKIAKLFAQLAQSRISHGDMKASNILVDKAGQPILIDLDALKEHPLGLGFERAKKKDQARFLRNWTEDQALSKVFRDQLLRTIT